MKSTMALPSLNEEDHDHSRDVLPHTTQRVLSALFYGVSSILVIFTNKAVMTTFGFPYVDFIATVQFVMTVFILSIFIALRKIDVPPLTWSIAFEVLPIALMFLGNVLCGLGSTRALSIPMFTALRRFSMLMIMLAEWCLLHVKPSPPVVLSISLMISGSILAACYDLSYDAGGYFMIFLNNAFTALNGVYMKKASISGKCTKMGVLFYNSLFSAVIMLTFFFGEHFFSHTMEEEFAALTSGAKSLRGAGDMAPAYRLSTLSKVSQHPGWNDTSFLLMILLSASMGSILNYSIFLCTTINSALTTAVVGTTKNIATTYIGMFAFSDYTFNWFNFVGINISIVGSIYYSYVTIFKGVAGYGQA